MKINQTIIALLALICLGEAYVIYTTKKKLEETKTELSSAEYELSKIRDNVENLKSSIQNLEDDRSDDAIDEAMSSAENVED